MEGWVLWVVGVVWLIINVGRFRHKWSSGSDRCSWTIVFNKWLDQKQYITTLYRALAL